MSRKTTLSGVWLMRIQAAADGSIEKGLAAIAKRFDVHPLTVRRWAAGERKPGKLEREAILALDKELGLKGATVKA